MPCGELSVVPELAASPPLLLVPKRAAAGEARTNLEDRILNRTSESDVDP